MGGLADRKNLVQISLARYSDCPVWYFPVQSRVVQSGEVKLRVRQSSLVKSSSE